MEKEQNINENQNEYQDKLEGRNSVLELLKSGKDIQGNG